MRNWKISARFWTVAGAAWLVGTGASGFLLYRVGSICSAYDDTFVRGINQFRQQDEARVMQVTFKKQVQEWKDILLRGSDPAALAKYTDAFHDKERMVRSAAVELRRGVEDPEVKALLDEFQQAHDNMGRTYGQALSRFVAAKGQNPHEVDTMVKGQDRAPTDLIDKVVERLSARAKALRASQKESVDSERRWIAILLLVCFTVVGALTVMMVRGTNAHLRGAVLRLVEGAHQVASAATQVSSAGQSLAQGTSEQAASLEETSASTQGMAAMTTKNAANSRQTAELMSLVEQRVTETHRTLGEMVDSMNEINHSSEKISRIIKVIDEIAYQTNILALNAAVEAARAGEAGVGFAVVADEVRNLAQRSAQAAKDTAQLIDESIARSSQGRTRLDRVAAAIHGITESTKQVKALVDEVKLGSEDQARRIEQVSTAVTQIEQVTQKAAASAEESSAAGRELSGQAESMQHVVQELRGVID